MNAFEKRRAAAAKLLQDGGVDAAVFVPGAQFIYLTGVHLHLMERPTLFALTAEGDLFGVMPALERQKWSAAMPSATTFYWDDADGPGAAFSSLADALGKDTVLGVEGLRMRAAEYRALAAYWSADALVDVDSLLAPLRSQKDDTEIRDLRKAIAISEAALGETFDAGIGGQTELQIAARLKAAMLAHGATGFAFNPIVLTGGASADPHGDASERVVMTGQPLLIDFGASYGDMHADITRTVFCGTVSDEHRAIYETVLKANLAGLDAVKAGNTVGSIDAAATDVLAASPFAELILHKTGHGLGREVHEAPQVMRSNSVAQQAGMVITVEPGLYRPGEIGVRIEDDVLITESGFDCLTSFSKDLVCID